MQISPFRNELADKLRQQVKPIANEFAAVEEATPITCEEIKEVLSIGGSLIDVRSPKDFNSTKIHHAVNIPLMHIIRQSSSWKTDQIILLYCGNGQQAGLAKNKLEALGFKHVTNIGSVSSYSSCS